MKEELTKLEQIALQAPAPTKDMIDIERHSDRVKNPCNESHKPPLRSDTQIEIDLRIQWAEIFIARINKHLLKRR